MRLHLAFLLSLSCAACRLADQTGTARAAVGAPDTATSAADTSSAAPADSAKVQAPTAWSTDADLAPRNLHQSWQHDPATTATVSWATNAKDLKAYTPKVWYATEAASGADGAAMPYAAAWTALGAGELYVEGMDDGSGDPMPTYVTWTVELTGLQPDTAYVFRAGTWTDFDSKAGTFTAPQLSDIGQFRTAPVAGTRKPFSVVLAGDSRGGTKGIVDNAARLAAIDANFWIFNGDFTNFGLQSEWDAWLGAMQPILKQRPLMPVQGNHEVFADMYYAQFALPIMAGLPTDYYEHGWSLNYGNVHFVGLDSNTDSTVQDQVPWLGADLEAARNDPNIDWIIAMMHHPAYSACTNHGSTDRVQKLWVPLFEKYNVDLVFAGHDHDYERTAPIRAGKTVDPGVGPVYIVAGGFYSPGYTNGKDWWTAVSSNGDKSDYVHLTIDGKNLSLKAYSGDGNEVLDDFAMTRP